MDIKDILSVGLTAEDFDTCIVGLDAIPEKAKAEEAMRGIMNMMLGAVINDRAKKEMEMTFDRKMKELEKKCAAQKDDLVILKSKLILLKRLLAGNEAMRIANEILRGGGVKKMSEKLQVLFCYMKTIIYF